LILFYTFLNCGILQAQEIDYLALSSILLRDKNYSRANMALKNAKDNWDDIEHEHYYLLRGLYKLRTGEIDKAIEILKQVKGADYTFKKNAYLAEAYYLLAQYSQSLSYINLVKSRISKKSLSIYHLKAKILFSNNLFEETFFLLNNLRRYKKVTTSKLTIHFLMEMGLFEEAYREMRVFLNGKGGESYLRMASVLRKYGRSERAILLLEEALLRYPKNEKALSLLAALYDEHKKKNVAGDLYMRLAYQNAHFSHDAAEYLKQNGKVIYAQMINLSVAEAKKQLLQKFSLYLSQENYDLASSLETPLKQARAFEDDDIKYAFAYTQLLQGKYQKSLDLLEKISSKKLLSKSLQLIKVVEDCRSSQWECYGTL